MIMQVLHCPHCQGTDIIRHGKTRQGKQRYCCQETVCDGRTFLLDYSYAGHSAEVLNPEQVEVEIWRSDELEVRRGLSSELDEMWSFVQAKANPRWLWHAIDHHTGQVLAYVFGRRKDAVFLRLQELLEPFGITKYYTDGWGAYERHIDAEKHQVGKENTQKIESKHINLRTRIKRLVRRTICFSKTEQMHDLVIGLFMNRYEFGRAL
jgi:insertion element IS1 protein InsB